MPRVLKGKPATSKQINRAQGRVRQVSPKILELEEEFDSPESSNVIGAGYSMSKQMLTIRFKSGTYSYPNVPLSLWEQFKAHPSKGKFVQTYIIGPDRSNPLHKGVKGNG